MHFSFRESFKCGIIINGQKNDGSLVSLVKILGNLASFGVVGRREGEQSVRPVPPALAPESFSWLMC